MKPSKFLPVSFLAIIAVFGGLSLATAQTAIDTTPKSSVIEAHAPDGARGDFRGARGGREDHGGRGLLGQVLKQVDADGDRAVTQAEIDTFRATIVAGADASGEGDISLEEFATIYLDLMRSQMVDAFQTLDEDGNGVVTQAEMDERFGDVVTRMDRNDDGKLDRADHGGRGHMGKGA
ncbi:EF-hand domain-containing protein [Puniceibacterium confluentis]|uniref:EF-hand domain-containing protein n=1 Tax=Puniceibacterium confluentis TaxID=1958944 RepID=UPI0011B47366|nr:hypothetical protein [Puniceibacterium confluentis]